MGWLITFRVLLSVSANAVQKRLLLDRAGVYQTWILTYSLMLGPALLLAAPDIAKSTPTFWREIALGGALDALGNLAMVAALRVTDISVFGPLNALRPILALLFGWVWLGESPSAIGMLGVAVTVVFQKSVEYRSSRFSGLPLLVRRYFVPDLQRLIELFLLRQRDGECGLHLGRLAGETTQSRRPRM